MVVPPELPVARSVDRNVKHRTCSRKGVPASSGHLRTFCVGVSTGSAQYGPEARERSPAVLNESKSQIPVGLGPCPFHPVAASISSRSPSA
jgi:hypothetical protein